VKSNVQRELLFDATESQNPGMCGNSMRGNRETPGAPPTDGVGGRSEKAAGCTSDMHATGESDEPIVPEKRTNNADSLAAESVEERGSTKRNADQEASPRTQGRTMRESIGLEGVRQAARRDPQAQMNALLHHVTPDLLRRSFYELKRTAAPGVDGVTWHDYERDLTAKLTDLHDRVHRGSYRATPSRRTWIPKSDGRQRPLGVASLEDKIVQQAIRTILEQVYEEDFLGFSYGFRPGRSQHQALDALNVALESKSINWVLDADIQGFFDAIDHHWMLKFLEHRIADRRVLRLIRKWLRAGVMEEGVRQKTQVGTPQGAVISPLLANIYLHYVLDLWVNQWRKREARGNVIIVRYADDFVVGFQYREDAERLRHALEQRMSKFGLTLHPTKTRLLEFGRLAEAHAREPGQKQPETFDFLGFTHHCGHTRGGRFTVKRKSIAKRIRTTLQAIRLELRKRMHWPVPKVGAWLRSVVQGWMNYHAVPFNMETVRRFRAEVARYWFRTLRRRSQKGRRWTWERFARWREHWLPRPTILQPYPSQRFAVTHSR
jgi:RNA-directed DNA polymerase